MIRRIPLVLLACCLAACVGPRTQEIRPTTIKPDGCDNVGNVWKLKVRFSTTGAPIGVEADKENDKPIKDPERLEVAECDNVRIKVKKGNSDRSAMLVFDKDPAFRTPGKKPAYLSRQNAIYVPIDNREGQGRDEFAYSIHVDCPEDTTCEPLDPMIIVER